MRANPRGDGLDKSRKLFYYSALLHTHSNSNPFSAPSNDSCENFCAIPFFGQQKSKARAAKFEKRVETKGAQITERAILNNKIGTTKRSIPRNGFELGNRHAKLVDVRFGGIEADKTIHSSSKALNLKSSQ